MRISEDKLPQLVEDIRKIWSPNQCDLTQKPTTTKTKNKMNIEKNIPLPARRSTGTIAATLRTMSVGDSVVIPKGQDIGWRSSAKSLGMKVASRLISKTECRLWRTA